MKDTFYIDVKHTVPQLHQGTMLVSFKPQVQKFVHSLRSKKNGECPLLEVNKDGLPIDPSYPAFVIDGITSVWKRFYASHCQVQASSLLTQPVANII